MSTGNDMASPSFARRDNAAVAAARLTARLLSRYRELTWEMTKREISDRYAGQLLGPVWVIGHPLLLMALYVVLFAYVFPARLGTSGDSGLTVYILSGLIPWMTFSEAIAKSTHVIISNANLVRQVVFPIEVLPVKTVLASAVTQVVATSLLVAYMIAGGSALSWYALLVVPLFFLQLLAMTGVCYLLSSIGAYFRDLKDVVQVFLSAGLFLAPILYVPDVLARLPEPLAWVLTINPFSHLVWCYQDALFFGAIEHPVSWFVLGGLSVTVFIAGFTVFEKLRVMFGEIL
jgi:lipopolysaccharide transport system permease protein